MTELKFSLLVCFCSIGILLSGFLQEHTQLNAPLRNSFTTILNNFAQSKQIRFQESIQDKTQHKKKSQELRKISDKSLLREIDILLSKNKSERGFLFDRCLAELVRRKKIESLERIHKAEPNSVEVLTALRRVHTKPDPLAIVIHSQNLRATPFSLPSISLTIQNVDHGKQSISFTKGGDYRGGRPERWRIELRDKNNNLVSAKSATGVLPSTGGGILEESNMSVGQTWQTKLQLDSFVSREIKPGKYRMTVYYHNTSPICDRKSIDGLIVSKSKPITIEIKPATIKTSNAISKLVDQNIGLLDDSHELVVVYGTYGKWAHGSVSPESPQGKIMSLGMKAVPSLVKHLTDKSYSARKRAFILSMLHSVTGIKKPDVEVLGSYKFIVGPWKIQDSDKNGGNSVSGIGSKGSGMVIAGEIKTKSQQRLVNKWVLWLKTIKIVENGK